MDMSSFECIVKKIALAGRWKSGKKILFPFDYTRIQERRNRMKKYTYTKKIEFNRKQGFAYYFPGLGNILHLTHTHTASYYLYMDGLAVFPNLCFA